MPLGNGIGSFSFNITSFTITPGKGNEEIAQVNMEGEATLDGVTDTVIGTSSRRLCPWLYRPCFALPLGRNRLNGIGIPTTDDAAATKQTVVLALRGRRVFSQSDQPLKSTRVYHSRR